MFRDETGFTPKVFCRIRRFHRALDRMEGRKSVEWANVALDCGYFDQAHFIHDFRAFSGINPSCLPRAPDAASQSRAAGWLSGTFLQYGGRHSVHNGCMANKVKPIPEGYHTVTPYIVVPGVAKLIDFAKQAFGATEV